MVRLRHLFLLAAVLIASLPVCAIGYHAVYADHPEENGKCLPLSYMPGAYFNVNLTDKIGWAKVAGTSPYIKAQLYFYTDEYLTQPASIYADDSGYLVDAVENETLKQTVRTNFLTKELRSFADFYFFIPQQIIDKMSRKYADNKEGKCKIYFKLRLTNRNGSDYIKANNSFKPGSFPLTFGGKSSFGFREYGCWTEFVGNRIERSLHFDNPDAKENLYNFKVHYYGTNLLKSECRGTYREPYSYRLSFWQDAEMTKPFNMDFSKPTEMYDGYEVAGNVWDDPGNVNPDRRNYIKGTRKDLEPFDIYVREVVLDGFFHQGCGVYDVDTFVTVYFDYQPDIPSLNRSTTSHTVGSFRWWHIPPPKETITVIPLKSKDYGNDDKKCKCGGKGNCGNGCNCGCPPKKEEPTGKCKCGGKGNCGNGCVCGCSSKKEEPTGKCDCGGKGNCSNGCDCGCPPEKENPKGPCICGGMGNCGNSCNCGCPPPDNNSVSHKHDWAYEAKEIKYWCPYTAQVRFGSLSFDLQLVQDEKNDSIVFYVMSAPVSQALYEHEMDENPSTVKDPSKPVTNVNSNDATFFISRLNSDISNDYGIKFRVPKKDEWLLAASQLGSMGKDYDEVLDEDPKTNTVRDNEGGIISNKVVGYYLGSRDSGSKPTAKIMPESASPKTCIRLIADQLAESALPLEVSVNTNARYGSKTNFRQVTRTLSFKRCKTCGKIVSDWVDY